MPVVVILWCVDRKDLVRDLPRFQLNPQGCAWPTSPLSRRRSASSIPGARPRAPAALLLAETTHVEVLHCEQHDALEEGQHAPRRELLRGLGAAPEPPRKRSRLMRPRIPLRHPDAVTDRGVGMRALETKTKGGRPELS